MEVPKKRFFSRVTSELASVATVDAGRVDWNVTLGTIGRHCERTRRGKRGLCVRKRRKEGCDIAKIGELAVWVVNGSRDIAGKSQTRSKLPSPGCCQASAPPRPDKISYSTSTENIFVLDKHACYNQPSQPQTSPHCMTNLPSKSFDVGRR